MSLYPNRKKLTEYPTVTPTLSDSVVNIQSSTVKQSTLQSILNLFNSNLPQATEFVKGAARLATQPEVNAGIDDSKIITPLKLSSFIGNQLPIASETNKGIIELATQTETNTGTDDTRAITPLKLTNRIASESLTGILALSSTVESENAGDSSVNISTLNDTKAVTPKKWRDAWNKVLATVWAFAEKISFSKGINLLSSTVPLVDGDITFNSNKYSGKIAGNVVSIITSDSAATESTKGVAEIATQAEVTTGTDDTRFITPLKLRQNQFNSATVTSTAINPFIVTLNSIAGNIIIPTGVGCNIISGTGQLIVLNNTFLTTTSVIEYTIRSYGKMLMQGGYNVTTNQANISVYNADITAVTQLDIYFKILNS
jgi:hypothetical protein